MVEYVKCGCSVVLVCRRPLGDGEYEPSLELSKARVVV